MFNRFDDIYKYLTIALFVAFGLMLLLKCSATYKAEASVKVEKTKTKK